MKDIYYYKAKIVKVYDGDTVTADIHLGFHIHLENQVLRLAKIDTPELRGEERESGLKSRDYLSSLILNKYVIIKTNKDTTGKYGRWLVEIYLDDMNVNDILLQEGYAKPWES